MNNNDICPKHKILDPKCKLCKQIKHSLLEDFAKNKDDDEPGLVYCFCGFKYYYPNESFACPACGSEITEAKVLYKRKEQVFAESKSGIFVNLVECKKMKDSENNETYGFAFEFCGDFSVLSGRDSLQLARSLLESLEKLTD